MGLVVLFVCYIVVGFTGIGETVACKNGYAKTCFRMNRRYLKDWRFNKRDCSNFPEIIPKGSKECSVFYFPGALQAPMVMSLQFKAPEDALEKYVEEYSQMVMSPVFTVTNHIEGKGLDVTIPGEFKNAYPNAEIYVVSYNGDWNHPSSFYFACDRESRMVLFYAD